MISLVKLILEGQEFDYGCAMLYFSFPEMSKIQDAINPEYLYEGEEGEDRTYGFEDSPHCTLLYGLHKEVPLEKIESVIKETVFSKCKLYNLSKFDNPKYDVLKFDVKGEGLKAANQALCQLPHTTEFPDYHPHATVAYLKKGTADKYISQFEGLEFNIAPTHAVYSTPEGTQHEIKINLAK